MDVAYHFVTSYKFNSFKQNIYLLTSLQFGQGRDSFSVFHTASVKASSAGTGEAIPKMLLHMTGKLSVAWVPTQVGLLELLHNMEARFQ